MGPSHRWRRIAGWILGIAAVLGLAIQFIPYGRRHDNPPVRREPAWDSARTLALVRRACFDCHSNEVRWPWYSHVAPMSWLVQRDVDRGRRELNFSEWDRRQGKADDAAEEVREGRMPPWFYLPVHPEARLSPAEKSDLLEGLRATIGED